MKANEELANRTNNRLLWITWGLFTIITTYIACNHEPWYDEYHVWVMCKHLKITWLWGQMMREGHFILWHSLIYPFVKLGYSFWCLQFVGTFFVSIAVWLILMKSPFNYISKCLVIFSYPLLYLFPVVARCYALVPILLFVTAWLYTIQYRHLYLYCFFVGLIAHSHAYMEGLVGSLFLLFCYEQIYLPYKKDEDVKKAIFAATITIFVVLFAYIQVLGSLQYAYDNLPGKTDSLQELLKCLLFFTTSNVLFIIPGDWHLIYPKFFQINPYYTLLYAILWGIIIFNLYITLWKNLDNRKFLFVCVGAIGWQAMMALFVYGFGHQRLFLPMLIIIHVLWLSYRLVLNKNVLIILLCFFILTAGHYNIYRDIKGVFSEDIPLLRYVENNIKPGEKLFFTSYFIQSSVSELYFNYDVHFVNSSEMVNVSSPKSLTEFFLKQAFKECNATDTVYIISDRIYENSIGPYKLTMLTNVGRYYLYKFELS